jgi:RNA polymerase sigma factor (sigma-70 family)
MYLRRIELEGEITMDQMVAILTQLRPAIQRLAGGGYDGEDLYGNVALACVEKAEHYDWTHPQIRTRVLRIARNLNIRRIRKERWRRDHILLSVLSAEHPRLATLECVEAEADGRSCTEWRAAVQELAEPYRRVIQQRFSEGKRFAAIARDMNMPSATVRTRCRRALQHLAKDPRVKAWAASAGVVLASVDGQDSADRNHRRRKRLKRKTYHEK